jgi:hypothetical protein
LYGGVNQKHKRGLHAVTDFVHCCQLANRQDDIETNKDGVGYGEFIGRFSIETFIVAPGVADAPADPFHDPLRILDALKNPATNPVQTYHLGLWFNNPQDVVTDWNLIRRAG